MLQQVSIPIRTECPPGACVCDRDRLLVEPDADIRPLRLTRNEEQRLLERIETITTYEQLLKLQAAIERNLGTRLIIEPRPNEVRRMQDIVIRLEDRPGLCKKVRQSVPDALRKLLGREPAIAFAILDARGLFGT